ncbi:MAG TPA: 7-carboxy-7-deazaguanine synthase QueE [Nitrospirota bacterium]|nr:7-carboxy-7-deazaguanine synthase QueE [Nitrospirota bacterium]
MPSAIINELFVSLQGEGPRVGERHIFVRFQGCDQRCCFCDTPASIASHPDTSQHSFQAQIAPAYPPTYEILQNPVTIERLTGLCARLSLRGRARTTVSLTGGEPLLQSDFLAVWLSEAGQDYRFYLETNGIRYDDLKKIVHLIDHVSMDMKLPSSTQMRPFWDEHRRFLDAASGGHVTVKAVITRATVTSDVLTAARIIAEHDDQIPFVLQPAGGIWAPELKSLMELQDASLALLNDVRVIPQMHKMLKVP